MSSTTPTIWKESSESAKGRVPHARDFDDAAQGVAAGVITAHEGLVDDGAVDAGVDLLFGEVAAADQRQSDGPGIILVDLMGDNGAGVGFGAADGLNGEGSSCKRGGGRH